MSDGSVRRYCSRKKTVDEAIRDVAENINSQKASLSLLFVASSYPLNEGLEALKSMGPNVIACTTAGEISREGYEDQSISAMSFAEDDFQVSILDVEDINSLDDTKINDLKEELILSLDRHHNSLSRGKSFALLFVDGLSMNEEKVTSAFSYILPGDVPLIGGSAGDGLNFQETLIYSKGNIKSNRASLVLVTTELPFKVFKSQHFAVSDNKMVITEADPRQRLVKEIDGEPAAEAYSRHLNVDLKDFSPQLYSQNPVILKIGDENYVRSIQKVNEDKSLTFYCAIEEGIVLSLVEKDCIARSVEGLFEDLSNQLGGISSCLLFECILRKLEVIDLSDQDKKRVVDVYKKHNACGFHTYGEQYGGTHVNQTITGIAFGHES